MVRATPLWCCTLLLLGVFLVGCEKPRETRFDEATTHKDAAVKKEAVPGDKLNAYFPKAQGDWDVVFAQEKKGQSNAQLMKDKKQVGSLAIFDTVSNDAAYDDFKDAKEKFDGKYPMVAKGKLGTAILVGDRFQVVVRSQAGADFSEDDRKAWLGKFDLAGLSTLK